MIKHLTTKTAALIEGSNEQRISYIQAFKWIPYLRAESILGKMQDLLCFPKSDRMPNILLVGDTNNGKTAILKRFASKNGPYPQQSDGTLKWPVLYIQAPPEPDEKRFYNNILDTVVSPYKVNDRADRKLNQVIGVIRNLEVKVLVIDEIQHILAGNQTRQKHFLNVIKYLSNELMIPFIGAGVRTAMNAIQNEEQLSNRFEPVKLQRWTMGEEYLRLLASFEQILPLKKPSDLVEEGIAYKILSKSEGTIGEIAKVVRLAAIMAIQNKSERITPALLERVDFIPPSDRMKFHKV